MWDDREQNPGVKFTDMELLGIPQMIIIGEKSFKENKVEFKKRDEEKTTLLGLQEVLTRLEV